MATAARLYGQVIVFLQNPPRLILQLGEADLPLALNAVHYDFDLRATADVKETNGKVLREDCSHFQIQKQKEQKNSLEAVTMETSQISEMATVIENKMDSEEKGIVENKDLIEEADFSDSAETSAMDDILPDLTECTTATTEHSKLSNGDETERHFKEAIDFPVEPDKLDRTESITSSISDTPSSIGSVYENELTHKRQDQLNHETSDGGEPSKEGVEDSFASERAEFALHVVTLENIDQTKTQQSITELCTQEDALSDISTESYHELEDNLKSCLSIEIAAASSDSETDEKWRTIFSSSINKEDDDDYDFFLGNSLEQSARDLFIQKSDIKEDDSYENQQRLEAEIPVYEEVHAETDNLTDTELLVPDQVFNATPFPGSSEISEDKDELCQPPTKLDPNKKVPNDYCVIQETKSENVSTEHVDFRVARKQWLKMEEQTKCQTQQPAAKHGTCQGGHSFMYTPVRNISKPKKDPEFESLGLREYAHTQLSPCSEDSGLDDSSYRSPFDDLETPIEREIRLAMEREESLRRERGIVKSQSAPKCTQDAKPVILLPSKFDKRLCQEVEEKRKMFETPDGYRLPNSSNAKTPSFIITSSPTKGQSYHEVAANNIIILEPDTYSTSPRTQCGPHPPVAKNTSDWTTNTSNVIILETPSLIIRSSSELCLNTVGQEPQESTFLTNPFFKLRSRSTQSLIDQEIQMVRQREEELKRERENLYSKENCSAVLMTPNLLENFDNSELPMKCKSSPSSPLRTVHKMDRTTLSCDNRFPENFLGGRRKSAMALRWEAGMFANNK